MSGFDRLLPGRKVVNEIISDGVTQPTGITGFTGQFPSTRYDKWTGPFLPPSSSARVLVATTASSNANTTVTAGLTNPDFPRAVRVAASTSQASTIAVTINGTDQFGLTVSDTINLGGGSPTVDGVQPFKTITSVVIPASTSGSAATFTSGPVVTIGLSNIFGTTRTPASAVIAAIAGAVNGTREATLPVCGAPSSSAGSLGSASRASVKFNTAATSSAGATLELLYFMQDTTHI